MPKIPYEIKKAYKARLDYNKPWKEGIIFYHGSVMHFILLHIHVAMLLHTQKWLHLQQINSIVVHFKISKILCMCVQLDV